MKKIYRNSLLLLAAGALAVSCADYNVTDDFKAEPDPTVTDPYKDLDPVKTYVDRATYPNLKLGAMVNVDDFNKQELVHAAAMTNFDNMAFGNSLMSGKIVNDKGIMNFMPLYELLDHMEEVGGEVFGSPIFANANQADDWVKRLTARIEIPVDYVDTKSVNYNDYAVGDFDGTIESGKVAIAKYDNQNTLYLPSMSKAYIIEGFKIEPGATYTTTFWANADKEASFYVEFSGNVVDGTATSDGKWMIPGGKWTKVTIESKAAEGVEDGYLKINMVLGSKMYIQKVDVGYYPDNHREQTEQEKIDTINYAMNTWCDRLMEIVEGRIKSFDLIDEPIDNSSVMENGMYDLKHSTSSSIIFWQDIIGSENYAPEVAKIARKHYANYGGDTSELKFYISETGLEDDKKMESLLYWINIWDQKGANIDGINAKVSLTYYEDQANLDANKQAYEKLLASLAGSGKLVRISNLDIKYVDASGLSVNANNITSEQREKLAEYNAYAIKAYMNTIPKEKQAGICKTNLVDSGDPVGLWSKNKAGEWLRSATYKAWCDALGGK